MDVVELAEKPVRTADRVFLEEVLPRVVQNFYGPYGEMWPCFCEHTTSKIVRDSAEGVTQTIGSKQVLSDEDTIQQAVMDHLHELQTISDGFDHFLRFPYEQTLDHVEMVVANQVVYMIAVIKPELVLAEKDVMTGAVILTHSKGKG